LYSYINVAVKKLHKNATQKNYYDLYRELKLMFQVGQHPNIVNLIGYTIENTNLYIITDYAKYGNLKEFLRKNGNSRYLNEDDELPVEHDDTNLIPLQNLLVYSYQIASGMEYLHSKNVSY
jgi:serine/threonine protein kinase